MVSCAAADLSALCVPFMCASAWEKPTQAVTSSGKPSAETRFTAGVTPECQGRFTVLDRGPPPRGGSRQQKSARSKHSKRSGQRNGRGRLPIPGSVSDCHLGSDHCAVQARFSGGDKINSLHFSNTRQGTPSVEVAEGICARGTESHRGRPARRRHLVLLNVLGRDKRSNAKTLHSRKGNICTGFQTRPTRDLVITYGHRWVCHPSCLTKAHESIIPMARHSSPMAGCYTAKDTSTGAAVNFVLAWAHGNFRPGTSRRVGAVSTTTFHFQPPVHSLAEQVFPQPFTTHHARSKSHFPQSTPP